MTKKIVITGCSGLVGLNLISILNSSTYEITGIDKIYPNKKAEKDLLNNINFIQADLSKPGEWQQSFENVDCLIQLQSQITSSNIKEHVRNNISSVKLVIKTASSYKIKHLIHLSSSVVIAIAKDKYSATKRKGEDLVKNSKIPYTILRPSILYGKYDTKHLTTVSRYIDISPIILIPGTGKYTRQPLYVLDLCNIIKKLIDINPQNKVYDIIGKEKLFFIDMLKIMAREKNLKRLFVKLPSCIFKKVLALYNFLLGKTFFVSEQLDALEDNDIFPVIDWDKEFDITYTSFEKGVKETFN